MRLVLVSVVGTTVLVTFTGNDPVLSCPSERSEEAADPDNPPDSPFASPSDPLSAVGREAAGEQVV